MIKKLMATVVDGPLASGPVLASTSYVIPADSISATFKLIVLAGTSPGSYNGFVGNATHPSTPDPSARKAVRAATLGSRRYPVVGAA